MAGYPWDTNTWRDPFPSVYQRDNTFIGGGGFIGSNPNVEYSDHTHPINLTKELFGEPVPFDESEEEGPDKEQLEKMADAMTDMADAIKDLQRGMEYLMERIDDLETKIDARNEKEELEEDVVEFEIPNLEKYRKQEDVEDSIDEFIKKQQEAMKNKRPQEWKDPFKKYRRPDYYNNHDWGLPKIDKKKLGRR